MDLKAERWNGSMQTGTQVWNGKVSITQGSLSITADKATLHYKDGERVRDGKEQRGRQRHEPHAEHHGHPGRLAYALGVAAPVGEADAHRGRHAQAQRHHEGHGGALQGDGGTGQVSLRILPKPKAAETAPANPPVPAPTPTPQQR